MKFEVKDIWSWRNLRLLKIEDDEINKRLRKSLKKETGEKEDKEEVQNLFEDAAQRRRHIQEVYIGYLSYQRK